MLHPCSGANPCAGPLYDILSDKFHIIPLCLKYIHWLCDVTV